MTIEIKEKGSRQFYKELVNITVQYGQILYEPNYKLRDYFTRYLLLTAAMVLLFLMSIYGGVTGSFNAMKILTAVFALVAAVATVVILLRLKKTIDGYLEADRPSVVTLDDEGVEIRKTGEEGIRVPWADVAFVRSFSESTCFFTKNQIETVLAVNNDHRKEITDYLKSSDIKVKIVV